MENSPNSNKNKPNSGFAIRMPLILALAISAGIFIGANVFDKDKRNVSAGENAKKFKNVLNYIEKYYVDTVDTDELTEFAIEKLLEKLDPHTTYIPPEEFELANAPLQGNFEGIGIEFNIFRDTVSVVSVIPGGPSEEVGLRPGDKIVEVNGETIAGANINNRKVVDLLRGEKGSKVKVGIKRKSYPKLLEYDIIRDEIPTYTIDVSYMIDQETGYIKMSRFGAKTYDEFKSALRDLKKDGMQQLVLDLRDNGGGYLDKAISIADEFLSDDKLIVYTNGQGKQFDEEARAKREGIFEKGPLVVLINENSASASEIVAGALQDHDRALLVGRRTYGKGLVQKPLRLSDNSELRLTISRYYTPSGRCIQKPYNDLEAYERDLALRYEHGEFFNADSIHVDESQQFKTANGRTVYGGGGIMPDYFIPQDTSYYSRYLEQLFSQNLFREYAYNYANEHSQTLKELGLADFIQSFDAGEVMPNFLAFAEKAGVRYKTEDLRKSEHFMENYLKSLIARGIWQEEGFYPVYHQEDEVFQRAIQLFKQAEQLEAGVIDFKKSGG